MALGGGRLTIAMIFGSKKCFQSHGMDPFFFPRLKVSWKKKKTTFSRPAVVFRGEINHGVIRLPHFRWIKQYKSMVSLKGFPL